MKRWMAAAAGIIVLCAAIAVLAWKRDAAGDHTRFADFVMPPVGDDSFDAQIAQGSARKSAAQYATRERTMKELALPLILLREERPACLTVRMLDDRVRYERDCGRGSESTIFEVSQPEEFVSLGIASALLSHIFGLTANTDLQYEEAVAVLTRRISIPFRRYQVEIPISVEDMNAMVAELQRRASEDTAQTPEEWRTYTNRELGFSVEHPPEMRVFADAKSKAIHFALPKGVSEEIAWSIWRNNKDILKFSTTEGVIAHIHPDDIAPKARKEVFRELVNVSGVFGNLVTVTVSGDRAEPWVYRIVFLDRGDHQFEIAAGTSTHPDFERFYRSFRFLGE